VDDLTVPENVPLAPLGVVPSARLLALNRFAPLRLHQLERFVGERVVTDEVGVDVGRALALSSRIRTGTGSRSSRRSTTSP